VKTVITQINIQKIENKVHDKYGELCRKYNDFILRPLIDEYLSYEGFRNNLLSELFENVLNEVESFGKSVIKFETYVEDGELFREIEQYIKNVVKPELVSEMIKKLNDLAYEIDSFYCDITHELLLKLNYRVRTSHDGWTLYVTKISRN